MSSLSWRGVLAFVLCGALLIRLWGTWYGLPFSYVVDEYHEVMRALQLGTGSFNFDRTGKGGFYLILFVEYGVYFVLLKLFGAIATPDDFAKLFVTDPTAFYLIGRITAAVVGTATVAAVFVLTRRAYSLSAGVLAAVLMAVNVLHIDQSRRIGVDVPMTFMATLALVATIGVLSRGTRRDYVLAGLFAALAATTKVTGVLILLPLVIAHLYQSAASQEGLRASWRSQRFWLAACVFFVVFVGTNPGIAVEFVGYASLFTSVRDSTDVAAGVAPSILETADRPNLYLYYVEVLIDSMGWPLFAVAMTAMAYSLLRRRPADVMLLSYGLANYVAIASTTSQHLYYPRYALPIIVVLIVLSGRWLADVLKGGARTRTVAVTVALILCLVPPVLQQAATAYALTQEDSRTAALAWFGANVPVGSRVLIEGAKIGPDRASVPLSDSREAMAKRISYWAVQEPRQAAFLERRLAVHQGGGYDLLLLDAAAIQPLETYIEQGARYFVIRPDRLAVGRKTGASGRRLLEQLRSDERVVLLKRFEGETRKQLGPTIEIFALRPEVREDSE